MIDKQWAICAREERTPNAEVTFALFAATDYVLISIYRHLPPAAAPLLAPPSYNRFSSVADADLAHSRAASARVSLSTGVQ